MSRRPIARLTRQVGRRLPKRRYILYCEGSRTEPSYFKRLRDAIGSVLVDVNPVAGVGVPSTIAEKAIEHTTRLRSTRAKRDSFERNDVVWAVFDRDEHPCFAQALLECHNKGVPVAASDPCFELWLIMHYKVYDKANHRHVVQKDLEKLCKEYTRSSGKVFECDDLFLKSISAIFRAEKQYKDRNSARILTPPYTTVFNLVKDIFEMSGIKLEKYK